MQVETRALLRSGSQRVLFRSASIHVSRRLFFFTFFVYF
ncbi:unnamed protein product [Nippostrongylus brasiliensis]|uniref:Uncharacterized protein n=1 Tax=Nippostrongylus brasiliensis TaxID=27835 RepID=A0A0N4XPJ7_NIPBR|nr:unnamed protein product [Nippostrongylus brasiliensis]